jgi:hypothetical protein
MMGCAWRAGKRSGRGLGNDDGRRPYRPKRLRGAGLYIAAVAIIVLFAFLISGAWLLMIGIYDDQTRK